MDQVRVDFNGFCVFVIGFAKGSIEIKDYYVQL